MRPFSVGAPAGASLRPALRASLRTGLLAGFLLAAAAALAHGEGAWIGENGWKNPQTKEGCCGVHDCAPVPADAVRRLGSNWIIGYGGRTHLYPAAQQLPSRDGHYWLCVRPDGSPRCFFVPGLGA